MLLVHHLRTLHTLLQEPDVINEYITHHIDLREFGTLLVGDTVVGDTCGEEDIRESINHQTVDFLWHRDIEATGTCGDVSQQNALLLGDDSHSHGRSQIIHHNHHIRRILLEIALKLCHHHTGQLIHILTFHAQINIRLADTQVREKRIFKGLIVFATGIDQLALHLPARIPGILYRSHHRSHLDEVRSRSSNNTNFLTHIF